MISGGGGGGGGRVERELRVLRYGEGTMYNISIAQIILLEAGDRSSLFLHDRSWLPLIRNAEEKCFPPHSLTCELRTYIGMNAKLNKISLDRTRIQASAITLHYCLKLFYYTLISAQGRTIFLT